MGRCFFISTQVELLLLWVFPWFTHFMPAWHAWSLLLWSPAHLLHLVGFEHSRAKCPNPWQLRHCLNFSIGRVTWNKQYSTNTTPNFNAWSRLSFVLNFSYTAFEFPKRVAEITLSTSMGIRETSKLLFIFIISTHSVIIILARIFILLGIAATIASAESSSNIWCRLPVHLKD